jgi:hypothetical protein
MSSDISTSTVAWGRVWLHTTNADICHLDLEPKAKEKG